MKSHTVAYESPLKVTSKVKLDTQRQNLMFDNFYVIDASAYCRHQNLMSYCLTQKVKNRCFVPNIWLFQMILCSSKFDCTLQNFASLRPPYVNPKLDVFYPVWPKINKLPFPLLWCRKSGHFGSCCLTPWIGWGSDSLSLNINIEFWRQTSKIDDWFQIFDFFK